MQYRNTSECINKIYKAIFLEASTAELQIETESNLRLNFWL